MSYGERLRRAKEAKAKAPSWQERLAALVAEEVEKAQ